MEPDTALTREPLSQEKNRGPGQEDLNANPAELFPPTVAMALNSEA